MTLDSNLIGSLGESRAQTEFIKRGYEVYIGTSNAYYDFVANKDGKLLRVEVKATTRRNKSNTGWIFDIRRSFGDLPFDNTKIDRLCLYIQPLDILLIRDSKKVTQKTEFLVLDDDI